MPIITAVLALFGVAFFLKDDPGPKVISKADLGGEVVVERAEWEEEILQVVRMAG